MRVEMMIVCDLKAASMIEEVLRGTAATVDIRTHVEKTNGAKPPSRYMNGKHNKGIHGKDLILEVAGKKKRSSREDFETAFAARGFAPASLSPLLSKAVHSKAVVANSDGTYSLA